MSGKTPDAHVDSSCDSGEDLRAGASGADSADSPPPPLPPKKYKRSRPRLQMLTSDDEETEDAGPSDPALRRKKLKLPLVNPLNDQITQERKWQRAMDLAVNILVPLKVDTQNLTLLPDGPTIECFKKAVQAFTIDQKLNTPLTFTSQKTFQLAAARFVFDFVLRASELSPTNWLPHGCVIWKHNSQEILHCLHGTPMIAKEHVIELDVQSENGQKALKEQPTKTKITVNKWGRSVVQVRHEDAACCAQDAGCQGGSFSSRSCGLFFTESAKALQAFAQYGAFQQACYPRMANAATHLLLPLRCECNWGPSAVPLLGRQTCKITPFLVNVPENLDEGQIDDPRLKATVKNPAVLVFQCCNPVYRSSRTNPQKNCDFKISAPDLICALQVAKKLWLHYIKTPPPLLIAEFKWMSQYQYQNTVLPACLDDADDTLF